MDGNQTYSIDHYTVHPNLSILSINKTENTKRWQGSGVTHTLLVGYKMEVLAVSYKGKRVFTIQPSNPTFSSNRNENTSTQKPVCECWWWLYSPSPGTVNHPKLFGGWILGKLIQWYNGATNDWKTIEPWIWTNRRNIMLSGIKTFCKRQNYTLQKLDDCLQQARADFRSMKELWWWWCLLNYIDVTGSRISPNVNRQLDQL